MPIRLVRSRDLVRVPWRNGGGTTAEIAVSPADAAGFGNFDWRLSMADVAADGPFSPFPDIDRTLVLIEGGGLHLEVGGETHRLERPGATLSFPGDVPVTGHLTDGPIRDFNVMTRRARFAHRVVCGADTLDKLEQPGEIRAVLALHGETELTVDGESHRLGRFDVILADAPQGRWSVDRPILCVHLRPAGASPA